MDFSEDRTYRNLPRVALVGRPNVGKSTLFNRLAHKRRCITDPTPGVTRDAVEAAVFLAGKPLCLIDTGGVKLDRSSGPEASPFDQLVLDRTVAALQSADLIMLILEAGSITALDEECINLLRPVRGKLLVCVNKTEGGRLVAESCNMFSYGFDDIHFISAEHGDNIDELIRAVTGRLDFSRVELEDDTDAPVKIALIGKPNTGKSTLSNRLTSSQASMVSDIPGTTRDVIEGSFSYKEQRFITLDTAGIRRKAKVHEDIEYYSVTRAIKTMKEADVVFLLIDALEGLSEQDKKIAALGCEQGRGIIFILNKWDMLSERANALNAISDRIRFLFPQMSYAPVLPLSATTGEGLGKILDTAIRMVRQLRLRTETAVFNQFLERWQTEYPPPSGPSTRFKIKYGLQVSVNPVVFKLFVSRPRAWTESYGSYISNRLRKDAGYAMIPVRLEIAPSREERHTRRRRRSR